ncbi:hypothetical protein N7539_004420 [Penicillium diatomitis]|uniref:Alpha/beta hydrolase fold-3 domain-containing protein n=1 Tax=Penicillium diatomitis TaxID=2819901 RepID=A0A9W9XDT1_9EURO|nr:uncharacterized protein N7539_004420 [Penicillium diatomitis]KAJ5489530.1 hypothetical protein N7539_004420 [Penicillium diatomitis]
MATTNPSLSLAEKLDFLPALVSIFVGATFSLFTGLWRSEREAKTLALHFGYAISRQATARLSPKQMQAVLPSSNDIYKAYAKKAGVTPRSVNLGHGAMGHWVGEPDAKNILIWYHGGGFSLPANLGYYKFYAQVIDDMKRAGKEVAIFSLEYTLAPIATYPTQLRQAVAAARYIISDLKHDPSTVFLGGDSAGGNLVCGVLSHAAHPHPQIEPLDLNGHKFSGATMIAPWTLLDTEFPPERMIYHGGDLITTAVAGPWSSAYLGDAQRDNYTDCYHAPTDWFKTFPVSKMLITGGGNEIMLPIIQEFAEKVQKGFADVEMFVGHRECHVAPVYNLELGSTEETEQGKKMKSWLRELAQ